jgi:hypothetical protein
LISSGYYVARRSAAPLACADSHAHEPLAIRCAQCKHVIVLASLPRARDRVIRWPAAALLVSYLVAIALVRQDGMMWPAYYFAAFTFLNLFAVAFSQGAVLRRAAIATVLVVALWAARLTGTVIPLARAPLWSAGPLAVWAALVGYALFLGWSIPAARDKDLTIRIFGAKFLMLAAFAFGMWAVIGIYPGYHLGYGWLPDAIAIALTGVPLVMVLADVILNAVERHEGIVGTMCAALAAAASYLGVVLLLLAGLDAVRRVFPWQVQGVQIISGTAPWQHLLGWLLAVAITLAALAVAISATGGLIEVTREFATAVPGYQLANIARAERRLAAGPDEMAQAGEQVRIWVLHLSRVVFLAGDFSIRVLFTIAVAAWRAIHRGLQSVLAVARILGAPLVALSACSLLMIAALHDVVRHAAGLGGKFGGPSLWGGLVWAAILILVLATLSFTLNPEAADRMARPRLRNPSVTISFLAAILAPATLIGWLFAAALTLATPALWLAGLALGAAGVHVPELGYGPLLRTSLLALLGLVILGSVPTLLAGSLRMRDDRPTYRDSRLITGGTLAVMACAGALALVLGWATIIHWLSVAR